MQTQWIIKSSLLEDPLIEPPHGTAIHVPMRKLKNLGKHIIKTQKGSQD